MQVLNRSSLGTLIRGGPCTEVGDPGRQDSLRGKKHQIVSAVERIASRRGSRSDDKD